MYTAVYWSVCTGVWWNVVKCGTVWQLMTHIECARVWQFMIHHETTLVRTRTYFTHTHTHTGILMRMVGTSSTQVHTHTHTHTHRYFTERGGHRTHSRRRIHWMEEGMTDNKVREGEGTLRAPRRLCMRSMYESCHTQ